jgi:GT2 family glycosyltransferase
MSTPVVCDLVLLSWNHLEQTLPCLESLFATVATPSRLIIVDNGSAPDVREALARVAPRGAIREVVLLQNEANEGFPRGMNRGLRASTAPLVCLLNNDLRFTPGWLEELIAVAQADASIGLVNPASNTFGHPGPSRFSDGAFAARLRERRGAVSEIGMCIGFCLLIPRAVIERIGFLTEDVECIFFEDEDYSMRAQDAGFRCVVAEGTYVHHAEHATVRPGGERDALFTRNQQWCERRWGRRIRVAWPRPEPVVPGSDELRAWLSRLLSWTRRRAHVYVYCPSGRGLTVDALFRSVGLSYHSDIHWHWVPPRLARWIAVAMILKRRKKPFDIIVAPDRHWARTFRRVRLGLRAPVVPEANEELLTAAWQTASRSPSSS